MKKQHEYSNHKTDGKASDKRPAPINSRAADRQPLRHLYRWCGALTVIFLTIVLWTIVETSRAEQENPSEAGPSQTKTQPDSDKSSKESKAPDQPPKADEPSELPTPPGKAGALMPPPPDLDKEDTRLYKLFMQYAEAMEKDPGSPETQELMKKLDEAREAMQEKLENDPKANLQKLPAAPTQARSIFAPSKNPRRITRKSTRANISRSVPKPIAAPESKIKEQEKAKHPPKPTERPDPAAKQPDQNDALVNQSIDQTSQTREKTDEIQIKLEDGYVQIKTQNDIIEINKLLETVGKEMKLNFIYPDGLIPTGKVKLQQYGKIHRRELLPLLESVLAFANYAMVRDDPYIRVVKRSEVHKKTEIFTPSSPESTVEGADSVVVKVIELKHSTFNNVSAVLKGFVHDISVITQIPNTNYIILTDYARRIPRLLEIIALVDKPGPQRKLEIMPCQYLKSSEAKSQVDTLLRALDTPDTTVGPVLRSPRPPKPPRNAKPEPQKKPNVKPPLISGQSASAKPNKSLILEDRRNNRLLVIGTDEQIEQVRHLLSLFDIPLPGLKIKLLPVSIEHIDASEAISQINTLIKALNAEQSKATIGADTRKAPSAGKTRPTRSKTPARPPTKTTTTQKTPTGAYMQSDKRTNRIMVVGSDEQIEQVVELLALLDVPLPGPEIRLAPLKVTYVPATEVSTSIRELINALNEQTSTETKPVTGQPAKRQRTKKTTKTTAGTATAKSTTHGPYMLSDERTNRILVVGSEEQIDQVRDLLELLDVPVPGEEVRLTAIIPQYIKADTAAEQISELIKALNEQEQEQEIAETGITGSPTETRTKTDSKESASDRRARSRTPARESKSNFIKTGEMGPILVASGRTNRLFVIGNDEQIEQVMELMELLDVNINLKLVPIQIIHVLSPDIAEQLSSLITALTEDEDASSTSSYRTSRQRDKATSTATMDYRRNRRDTRGSRRGSVSSSFVSTGLHGPMLLPDERTNRLLIVGTVEQVNMVKELLPLLDVPPSEYDKMILKIFQPRFVDAAEAMKILDDLGITRKDQSEKRPRDRARQGMMGPMPPMRGPTAEGYPIAGLEEPEIRTAVQESTNRIFVYATEYQLRDIEEIMANIDIDPNDAIGAIQIYALENRKPEDVAEMLKELLKSEKEYKEEGKETKTFIPGEEGAPIVVALEEIHAVAVRGSKRQHEEIQSIIKTLDKRLAQVLVEAILVRVSSSGALNLGVGLQDAKATEGDRTISGVSPFGLGATLTNGIVRGTGGTLAFFDDDMVYATLEALQGKGNSKVVSKPRVLVNDNIKTTIKGSRMEPTTKTTVAAGSDTPITEFGGYEEAGTTLTFTPHISEGNFLQLEISLNVDSFDASASPGLPPAKSVNNLETSVNVPHGKTIILGGLTSVSDSVSVNKIPILGDLPLIGALFRNVSRTESEAILYVFVRAYIVRSDEPGVTDEFQDLTEISDIDSQRLQQTEEGYKRQPIIPGIEDKKKEKKDSALDHWYNNQKIDKSVNQ